MKNLSFLLGCFLFFFSYCQTPTKSRTRKSNSPTTSIARQICELKTSEIAGYLDFVRCFPKQGYCAHFFVPESTSQSRGIPLGSTIILSGDFSLEGTTLGNKYYYLVEDLEVSRVGPL